MLTFSCLNAAKRGSAVLNVQHSSDLGISDAWLRRGARNDPVGPVNGVTFTVTPGSPLNSVDGDDLVQRGRRRQALRPPQRGEHTVIPPRKITLAVVPHPPARWLTRRAGFFSKPPDFQSISSAGSHSFSKTKTDPPIDSRHAPRPASSLSCRLLPACRARGPARFRRQRPCRPARHQPRQNLHHGRPVEHAGQGNHLTGHHAGTIDYIVANDPEGEDQFLKSGGNYVVRDDVWIRDQDPMRADSRSDTAARRPASSDPNWDSATRWGMWTKARSSS